MGLGGSINPRDLLTHVTGCLPWCTATTLYRSRGPTKSQISGIGAIVVQNFLQWFTSAIQDTQWLCVLPCQPHSQVLCFQTRVPLRNIPVTTTSCCRFRKKLVWEGEEIHCSVVSRREEAVLNSGNFLSKRSSTKNIGYILKHREEDLTDIARLIRRWSSCVFVRRKCGKTDRCACIVLRLP